MFSYFRGIQEDCCQLQAEYVHELLFNRLVKLSQKKVWLGELVITIAVDWDVKLKQTFLLYFFSNKLIKMLIFFQEYHQWHTVGIQIKHEQQATEIA